MIALTIVMLITVALLFIAMVALGDTVEKLKETRRQVVLLSQHAVASEKAILMLAETDAAQVKLITSIPETIIKAIDTETRKRPVTVTNIVQGEPH